MLGFLVLRRQWHDIARDKTQPHYFDVFQATVASNLELAKQHPELFSARHYAYFKLPVVLNESRSVHTRPEVPAWEETSAKLSDEFGQRKMAREVNNVFLSSLGLYKTAEVQKVWVFPVDANIGEYDFDNHQFPVRLSSLSVTDDDQPIFKFFIPGPNRKGGLRIALNDGTTASVSYGSYEGAIGRALDATLKAKGSASITFTDHGYSYAIEADIPGGMSFVNMGEEEAQVLRQKVGRRGDASWDISVRYETVELSRDAGTSDAYSKATGEREERDWIRFSVQPIRAVVIGGRLSHTDRQTGKVTVIKEFGEISPRSGGVE